MDDLSKIELRNLKQKIKCYNDDDERKGRREWNSKYNSFNYPLLLLKEVLELLKTDGAICYYCKNNVLLDYTKRHSRQITMERVRNSEPHHIKNLKVCCFGCNMLRGDSMTSQKFKDIFVRQFGFNVRDANTSEREHFV